MLSFKEITSDSKKENPLEEEIPPKDL